MHILVDADACPVVIRDILYRAAQKRGIKLTLFANQSFQIPASPLISLYQVAKGPDMADHEIVARVEADDLVITADIPLASEVLEKGALVVTPRGERYTENNIRQRLQMRDFMEIVRLIVRGQAAERVRYQGDVHRIRWRATWNPTTPPPPVYMSASGPNMVRLAGEVSDGVGIGIMSSVAFVRDKVRPNARAGAEAANRDPDALLYPTAATVSINPDVDAAREASKRAICKLYHPIPHPYYDSQLRQMGFEEFADQATELVPAGRLRQAMELVPDEVVDTMTITGNLEQCIARVRDYEGIADELILARTGQRGDMQTLHDYEEFFHLVSHHSD